MNCTDRKMTLQELERSSYEADGLDSPSKVWKYLAILTKDSRENEGMAALKESLSELIHQNHLPLVMRVAMAEGMRSEMK